MQEADDIVTDVTTLRGALVWALESEFSTSISKIAVYVGVECESLEVEKSVAGMWDI